MSKETGSIRERRRESNSPKRRQPAGAPWWLVIVLVLVLLALASYIAWMNSAQPNDRKDFLAFFLGPHTMSTQTVAPDTLAVWENSLLNSTIPNVDSTAQDWQNNPDGTGGLPDTALTQVPPSSAAFNDPVPDAAPEPAQPGYYIKAGEFKSRNSALFRVSDLRQGNYPARIIEPDSAGGTFIVSAGEFTSYTRAREQARTIGFILDIRTSVVKKE